MEELIRIIQRFDKYKMPQIDILNNKESKTNATKLYRAILENKIANDDDAAKLIFGEKASKLDSRYTTLKSDFKKRVFNTFLFVNLDVENLDDYYKAIYEANYRWMVIKNLLISNLTYDAFESAIDLLNFSIKYEYTQMATIIIPHIKTMCANKGDKLKHNYYTKLNNEIREQYDAECKARDYQELLRIEYVNSVAFRPENAIIAKNYFEELKPLLEKYQTNIFHLYAREVETYIYSAVNNYEGLLGVAERALAFFYSKKLKFKIGITIFLLQKMVALMHLRKFEAATEITEEYLKLREHGTFNWFKGMESKVFLLFRMKRYVEAHKIYTEIIKLPGFKTLEGLNKEIWQLFFLHFYLIDKNVVGINLPTHKFSNDFSFKTFKNDTPTLEHDKRGMNLILNVLELCINMLQSKDSKLIDREESMKKYLLRYSDKNDQNYRVALFGKMVLMLSKFSEDKTELKTNLEPLLNDFSKTSSIISETLYRSEIIELEDVWDILLERMEVEM